MLLKAADLAVKGDVNFRVCFDKVGPQKITFSPIHVLN